jgi:two-component system, OmpR family, sensor kinase
VAHRAELTQQAESEASARSRRATAEQLVTVLAHDFRNLLTPLRARLDLLGRRAARDGHDRYVVEARELVRTVDRLNSLVRDLMDTARLEQGLFALNPEPVDLVGLVSRTAADFTTSAGVIDVRCDLDELVVCADPDRLRQVLENLLANAFAVQPPDVPVMIALAACGGWAEITVADLGPGIPADVRSQLFQLFAAGSGSGGLGVGLYLARGITQAHGGSIRAESEPGNGTRFIVRLPLDVVPTAAGAPIA